MYVYRLNLVLHWCVSVSVLFIFSSLFLWECVILSRDVDHIFPCVVCILVLPFPKEQDARAFKETESPDIIPCILSLRKQSPN